ncbi:MAG: AAA family ATPase, partial [Bacteroidales bacterium]|nr:AAA family ATPase [Bacteroidales bacterium]
MEYINRILENDVRESLVNFPVVAVLGPRQCGKSTMVKHLVKDMPNSIYLDLERPSDLQKLEDAEWFLSYHKDKLVCLDEIQRCPDLFPVIRSLVD